MTLTLAAAQMLLTLVADPSPQIEISGCITPGKQEISQRIDGEVQARGLQTGTVRLAISCAESVLINAFRASDGAHASRQVHLQTVALAAQAHVIALAAVELVQALMPTPVAIVTPPKQNTVAPFVTGPHMLAKVQWQVAGFCSFTHFSGLVGWAPRVGGEVGAWRGPWGASVVIAGHAITRDITGGQGTVNGGQMQASLNRRLVQGRFSTVGSVGGNVAISHFSGRPSSPDNVGRGFVGAWGGPQGALGLQVALTKSWFAQLSYEIGYALVTSGGVDQLDRDLQFHGLWHGPRLLVGSK